MADVLLLGGSGLVGRFLLPRLLEAGFSIEAISRRPRSSPDGGRVRWRQLDLADPSAYSSLGTYSILVSLLPIWLTADVCRALDSRTPRRIVAFSSTSAVTKHDSASPAERSLAKRLLQGERNLTECANEEGATILRPTMIYGGTGDRNVERVAEYLTRFPVFPLVAGGAGRRQPVHAADLASAVIGCIDCRESRNKTYAIGGDEVLSFRDMISRIGSVNGVNARFLEIPLPVAGIALRAVSIAPRFRSIPREALTRMGKDMIFSNVPATQDFGYKPRGFQPVPIARRDLESNSLGHRSPNLPDEEM